MPSYKLTIHLTSGEAVPALVEDEEIEHHDAEDVGDLIEMLLNEGDRRKWVSLGDVYFHPQAITAITFIEEV